MPRYTYFIPVESGNTTSHDFLNDTNVEDAIRSMEVSSHVSPIAALGFVRELW